MAKVNIEKSKSITSSYSDWLYEQLQNPDAAREHIQSAIELYEIDQDKEALMLAIRDVANARGGIGKLAKETSLNREHLYYLLSGKANPRLDTLTLILKAFGLHLTVAYS